MAGVSRAVVHVASVPNPSRLALPAALALLVLSSLLCLGVLAAPRPAPLSEADRLAVLEPIASFAERRSAYVECTSAVPVDAVTLRTAELRDGSTVELRVSEGARDVLFAVAPSDSVSAVTVERASVGGSDSLGLFLGHGVERGDALWCAYSLDALPADPSDLSAVVRCVYPDGFEHVVRWGGGAE